MPSPTATLVALLPVFNDWSALRALLPRLEVALVAAGRPFAILIVDDASEESAPGFLGEWCPHAAWVRILRLRSNLGHQRALAVGLAYIDEHVDCEAVAIMDADGEDRPEDLPELLARYVAEGERLVVFAERRRRAEGALFRLFYLLYRLLHRCLTGRGVRFGNYSVLPAARLRALVVTSELWVHYAAAVVRSRLPHCTVPTTRDKRIDGRSSMGFVGLVVHGLSAIAVYSDVVFTRLLVATSVLAAGAGTAMAAVVAVWAFTSLAIPGWATYTTGLLAIIAIQAVTFAVALTFLVLGARQQGVTVPRRDYAVYVEGIADRPRVPSP